jgi:hypothetical protein
MTELKPLLSSSTDDFERALLRSSESDELGGAALLRTASLFGIGASAVLPVVAAVHAGAGGAPAALWPIVVKWLGFGVCCGAALGGAASLVSTDAPRATESELGPSIAHPLPVRSFSPAGRAGDTSLDPRPVAQNSQQVAALARRVAPSMLHEPDSADVSVADSPSVAAFAPVASAPAAAASIADQIQAIERARQALAASRASDALSAIQTYRTRWPNGELTPEAIVLGVRAKKILGDTAGAEHDARALIARDPDSRYAAQLRALLGIGGAQ